MTAGNSSPFRRKKTPVEAPPGDVSTEAAGDVVDSPDVSRLEPGVAAQMLVDVRRGVVDREVAGQIARPLGELAKAFALQAEVLRSVHDTQKQLQEALQSDKRSDLMLNSTNALNETFRGVRSVQQGLIDKLDKSRKSTTLAWWGAALFFVCVIASGAWYIQSIESGRSDDAASLSSRMERIEGGVIPQQQKLLEQTAAEKAAAEEQWRKSTEELAALRAQTTIVGNEKERLLDELESLRKKSLDDSQTINGLRQTVAGLEIEVREGIVKRETLEGQIAELNDKLVEAIAAGASRRPRSDKSGFDVPIVSPPNEGESTAVAKASESIERLTAVVDDEAVKPSTPAESAPVAGGDVEVMRKRLNLLLSKHRGTSIYSLDAVGRIEKDHLEDVVLSESAPGKGVIKTVLAKSLKFALSPQGDLVELNFATGSVKQEGSGTSARPTPFYNDKYRMTIYCKNPDEWLAAREGFIVVN